MDGERVQQRILWLMDEIRPMTQHNDLGILPLGYSKDEDILYMDVIPRSGPKWAETAYRFAKQDGMKYDRDTSIYPFDGQPRVSYSGGVWVRFIGDFMDGSKYGEGEYNYHNGAKYSGHFVNNLPDGKGTMTYPDGARYEGGFRNGKFRGQGTFSYSDGGSYSGEFKRGKKNGQGTYTFPDGSKQTGLYRNDKFVKGK